MEDGLLCASRLHSAGASPYLGFAGTLVESVDLPDIRVGEPLPLANLTLGGMLRNYRLLTPGLNTDVTLFRWKSFFRTLELSEPFPVFTLAKAVLP